MAKRKRISGFKFKGLTEMLTKLKKTAKIMIVQAEKGLLTTGLIIMKESARQCPIVTGNLRASAYLVTRRVQHKKVHGSSAQFKGTERNDMNIQHENVLSQAKSSVKRSNTQLVMQVGYSANYAFATHENPVTGTKGWMNKKGKPIRYSEVGNWKFLSRPFFASKGKLRENIIKVAKV